jgi:hypothetical protein
MNENPRRRWLQFSLSGLLVLMVVVAMPLGCGALTTHEFEFVLPVGFRGQFAIVESPAGLKLRENQGKYIISVESPLTIVVSAQPLREPHRETVVFADGQRATIGPHAGPDIGNDVLALRCLGTQGFGAGGHGVTCYVYGTQADADSYDYAAIEKALADLK